MFSFSYESIYFEITAYVDYLVFDSSVFEANKIDGEDNVPMEFICGDRNGQIGVLNAINSGISVGKIVASAG